MFEVELFIQTKKLSAHQSFYCQSVHIEHVISALNTYLNNTKEQLNCSFGIIAGASEDAVSFMCDPATRTGRVILEVKLLLDYSELADRMLSSYECSFPFITHVGALSMFAQKLHVLGTGAVGVAVALEGNDE
jgi:hypothetical protein